MTTLDAHRQSGHDTRSHDEQPWMHDLHLLTEQERHAWYAGYFGDEAWCRIINDQTERDNA